MIISSLVAMTESLLIGKNNDLPWQLQDDLLHFKNYSLNKAIIMGRNTYDSIGKPLPNRCNIVLSSSMAEQDGVNVVRNFSAALDLAKKFCSDHNQNEIVIIGGAKIFAEAENYINKLVITWVDAKDLTGDVYYPSFDLSNWKEISEKTFNKDERNEYNFTIKEYLLKK